VRQHRAHASCARLEALEAQQRVEPEQLAAGLVQPLHRLVEIGSEVAIEPVADQQHDRVLSEHPTRPAQVEFLQAAADARATGPVCHGLSDSAQRYVDIPVAQVACDVREPGAEYESMHAVPVVGERVKKVQEHARVAAH